MAKTRDVPTEMRDFNKVFERFSYRWDVGTIFNDYLDYCIEVFNIKKTGEVVERLKSHYKDDYKTFIDLFREHVLVMDKMITNDTEWYDLLGTYYEVIASRSKASAMGQFFTPASVCNFMADINGACKEATGQGLRISDPACGSGRTLLAWHAKAPGNYLFGDDKDPMCTKMCAINFAMHGAVGQVNNMNSLWPEEWYFGYEVNASLNKYGIVGLRPITKEESFSVNHWRHALAEAEKPKVEAPPEQEIKTQVGKNGQINFFEML